MKRWIQRIAIFSVIVALIAGGLGWATVSALRMEDHRRENYAQKDRSDNVRRALWRLDGFLSPLLAREDSRPFAHFSALHSPVPAMTRQGVPFPAGNVFVPSPLMDADLPHWVMLHFQYLPHNPEDTQWQSPQVLATPVRDWLRRIPNHLAMTNVTPEREELLMDFAKKYPSELLLTEARKHSLNTLGETAVELRKDQANFLNPFNNAFQWQRGEDNAPANQAGQQQAYNPSQTANDPDRQLRREITNTSRAGTRFSKEADPTLNLESIASPKGVTCDIGDVRLSSMAPIWFPSPDQPDYLLFVRMARFEQREIVQGVIIDWIRLRDDLRQLVADLFPEARLAPLPPGADPDGEGAMSVLPVQLNPGPALPRVPAGWTPLRMGLAVAWAAAALAVAGIAVGGWSLIDLSERRIRFVSAVTHELRTPLTTLRLYLDMLTSGLVSSEAQKEEYLKTLNSESERLHRLISNVLDFSRLEKQTSRLQLQETGAAAIVEGVNSAWKARCESAGKTLVVETHIPVDATIKTDPALVQQVLGNLIDNACKYSKDASDPRVCLRVIANGVNGIAIEVEDCGPGVARSEWRSVFRPFRRGCGADTTAGGVGLGLALARRWAGMLGGRLDLCRGELGNGACFRLELPRG